jgi:hypothetical protein
MERSVADNPNRGGRGQIILAWFGMAVVLAVMFVFFAE